MDQRSHDEGVGSALPPADLVKVRKSLGRCQRSERILKLQTLVLEEIARDRPISSVCDLLLQGIEEICERMSASILLLNSEKGTLTHEGTGSLPFEYVQAIDGIAIGDQVGSCGAAAFLNEMVIVGDIATDKKWGKYRDLALQFHLRACWAVPIRDSGGAVLGTFAMYYYAPRLPKERDIELIHLASHLAAIAIEFNRRKIKMLETDRQLQESLARKDRFLAMLGHELRNPLAVIAGGAALLAESNGERDQLEGVVASILRQALHVRHLIDDLLDVSRISFGKVTLDMQSIDICLLVRHVVEIQRQLYQSETCTISMRCPSHPVWCRGDKVRLSQCLVNLIENSVKFSNGACKIEIVVSLAYARKRLRIMVTDDGMGIDESTLSRVFVPFESGTSDVTLADKAGLGLGLAIVKGLVELHGGQVTAASQGAGLGSEFVMELPTIESELTQHARKPQARAVSSMHYRVLVIEDSLDLLALTKIHLERAGHQVYTAVNGEQGVELASKVQPDIVLCDLGLPTTVSGYDVVKLLRANPQLAGTYVVAMTGFGQESDRARAERAGFDYHLVKPVDDKLLKCTLRDRPKFATIPSSG